MAIIRNLTFLDNNKFQKLKSKLDDNIFNFDFLWFPFDIINHILPLKLKFKEEYYGAFKDNEIKGLVSLEKEKGKHYKLKFTKLFIDKDSNFIGEQLINFVISRYLAFGANIFYVVVNEKSKELLNLFIDVCNFRVTSFEYLYKVNNKHQKHKKNYDFTTFDNQDTLNIQNFYNYILDKNYKIFFEKSKKFFETSPVKFSYNYILKDKTDKINAYFKISTMNDKNFVLDFIVDKGYENILEDIIDFSFYEIKKRNKDFNLYVRVKNYFSNSKEIIKNIENLNLEFENKNLILTKNNFHLIEEKSFSPQLLFNDRRIEGV